MTTEVAREVYLDTLEKIEDLLERWRHGWLIDDGERQAVWIHLDQTVKAVAKRHFKQRQNTYRGEWWEVSPDQVSHEQHIERVMQLADFLRDDRFRKHNVAKVIVAYKRRFAQLEALREMRHAGITIPDGRHEQNYEVLDWVFCSKLRRQALIERGEADTNNVLELWERHEKRKGRTPTAQRRANFITKWEHYQHLHNYAHPRQLESHHCPRGMATTGSGPVIEDDSEVWYSPWVVDEVKPRGYSD